MSSESDTCLSICRSLSRSNSSRLDKALPEVLWSAWREASFAFVDETIASFSFTRSSRFSVYSQTIIQPTKEFKTRTRQETTDLHGKYIMGRGGSATGSVDCRFESHYSCHVGTLDKSCTHSSAC